MNKSGLQREVENSFPINQQKHFSCVKFGTDLMSTGFQA